VVLLVGVCIPAWADTVGAQTEAEPVKAAPKVPDRLVVNVNTATLKELLAFPKIDLPLACLIIHHRVTGGTIETVEEFCKIEGIDEPFIEGLSGELVFTGETTVPSGTLNKARTRRRNRREKAAQQKEKGQAPGKASAAGPTGKTATGKKKVDEKVPIDMVADYLEYKNKEQIMVAKGAAHVVHGDREIRARVIEADMKEEKLLAYGDVVYWQGEGKEAQNLQGDMIMYDLRTGEARIRDGWTRKVMKKGALYYGAGEMAAGMKTITGENAFYTTCDDPEPHWKIVARRVIIYPKKRMVLKHASTYVCGKRLYTVGHRVVPLGEKEEQALKPGFRQDRGFYVEYKEDYEMNEKNYGKVNARWFQEQGQGAGVSHNYSYGEKLDGNVTVDLWSESDLTGRSAAVLSRVMQQRWDMRWNLNYRMDQATMGKMNASLARKEYSGEVPDDELRLNFLITQKKKNFTLTYRYDERIDLDGSKYLGDRGVRVVDRLPEVVMQTPSRKIIGTDLSHSLKLGIGRFRQVSYNYTEGKEDQVSTFRNELKYTLTHRALSFMDKTVLMTPRVTYEKIKYQTGGFLEGIHFNLRAIQKYRPKLTGTFNYDRKKSTGETPLTLVSTDRSVASELNKLNYRLDFKPQSSLNLTILNAYYQFPLPTSKTGTEGFGSTYTNLTLRSMQTALKKWSFDMKVNYDFHGKKLGELQLGDIDITTVNLRYDVRLKDEWTNKERWRVRLMTAYDHRRTSFQSFNGTFSFPVGDKILCDLDTRFDVNQKRFTRGHLTMRYDLHCWEARVDIGQKKRDFEVKIYLKAFPEKPFGLKYDDKRQTYMPYYGDRSADNLYY